MKKIKRKKEYALNQEGNNIWITFKQRGDKRIVLRGKDFETIQSLSISMDNQPTEEIDRTFSFEGNEIIVDVVGNPILADYIRASGDVHIINRKEMDPMQDTMRPITKEEAKTYVLETLLPSAKDALVREGRLYSCALLVNKVGEEFYAEVVDMACSNDQEKTQKINLLCRSVANSDCQFVVTVAKAWYVIGESTINARISQHPERKAAIVALLSIYDMGNITFLLPFEKHGNEIVFADLEIADDGEGSSAGGRYLDGLWDSRKDKERKRKWN